ncbi:MAG TPA: ZIP family metal transporter [Candidatus Saccharimonadales bacterium]|nr:ZIP family metal transporter [Candidatus Saccharimonadales bacterium]
MTVFILTVLAAIAALAGGVLAIRSRRKINLAVDFTAGIVLGLVAFDLLPEIFNIAGFKNLDPVWPMLALVIGFLLFHLFERLVPLHETGEEQYGPHRHPWLGTARAAALTGHSFLDGLSIGVAFQAGNSVGVTVAIAVIGHRFADGFDTTTFMLVNKNKLAHIRKWLTAVIVMPVIGGLVSLALSFSESVLAVYLGFFAGFILYIAASNIMPQAHGKSSLKASFLLTVLGALFILGVTRVSGF